MSESEILQTEKPLIDMPVGKFGIWIFLVSEIMLFTGLVGSYIVLRLGSAGWPDPGTILNTPLLGFNTLILLSSSLTMALALEAVRQGKQAVFRRYLLLTAVLGTAFLGIKGFDYFHMWRHGFTLSSSLFGSCYYLLTGFHALHVLSGVILIMTLFAAAGRGAFSAERHGRVEYSGLYWHFIDIVWVILFTILCLV
jgi:heme/copper-type cytochrome/quinol oxidase subunit 3